MKFDPNDPILTAYVLDELDDEQRAEVDQLLAESEPARREIAELRRSSEILTDQLAAEPCPELEFEHRHAVTSKLIPERNVGLIFSWRRVLFAGGLSAAAALVFSIVMLTQFGSVHKMAARHAPPQTPPNEEIEDPIGTPIQSGEKLAEAMADAKTELATP